MKNMEIERLKEEVLFWRRRAESSERGRYRYFLWGVVAGIFLMMVVLQVVLTV